MRFHWLLYSIVGFLIWALPAQAGQLLSWRFETNNNRLTFTTDDGVQPRAQLIPNPTRIVIDLPGISLNKANINRPIGGLIKSVRVGQFDTQTTRLVIEIAQGYTVDPQQVKIKGLSATQWVVDLPTPQPIAPAASPSPDNSPSPNSSSNRPSYQAPNNSPPSSGNDDFQITRNGLFVRLDRNGDDRSIRVKRNRNGQKIDFELPTALLPRSLVGQTLPVNSYGVDSVRFEQSGQNARISMTVADNSPDWQGIYSRFGGLVLLPRGGLSALESNFPTSAPPSPSPSSPPDTNPTPKSSLATITEMDLTGSNNFLLIRGDRPLRFTSRLLQNGFLEIKVIGARLSPSFRGPQFSADSPIYQVRVREEGQDTVVFLVQSAFGYSLGQLTQPNNQMLALELRSSRPASTAANPSAPTDIIVPSSPGNYTPPRPANPPVSAPRRNDGKLLVVLDPGHGGKDPGAIGIGGIQEKDIILPISQEVARILEQQNIQVMLTRNSDYFVSLEGRTQMANRANADLFVSIHANSMGKGRPDVNGLEVYYFGDRRLADVIYRNILRSVSIQDRGVRRARFYVLRTSNMPSTLVEVGFVTGGQDARNLSNRDYRNQMAAAIARGIIEYIQRNRL
ncbi:MAG: N-acetylmuramoyl-L-alanine amidase [Chlorogloea purpurea SAG 13.99]|nr:N-acetylmuramoyl-L-alanine amidase [Chlorogloea purpurea SAG 13.99]